MIRPVNGVEVNEIANLTRFVERVRATIADTGDWGSALAFEAEAQLATTEAEAASIADRYLVVKPFSFIKFGVESWLSEVAEPE